MPKILILLDSLNAKTWELLSDTEKWLLQQTLTKVGIKSDEYEIRAVVPHGLTNWQLFTKKAGGSFKVTSTKFFNSKYDSYVEATRKAIEKTDYNVCLALGAVASAVMVGDGSIMNLRGTITPDLFGGKTIVSYSPMEVLMDRTLLPIWSADLKKTNKHKNTKDLMQTTRTIYIPDTVKEIEEYIGDHDFANKLISTDIETKGWQQISCIGFAPDSTNAIVIPFMCETNEDGNYWRDAKEEAYIWDKLVRKVLTYPQLFQNGMFDMSHLWKNFGLPTLGAKEDTMLAHHALFIELKKGLAFMASIYADEVNWKYRHRTEGNKGED